MDPLLKIKCFFLLPPIDDPLFFLFVVFLGINFDACLNRTGDVVLRVPPAVWLPYCAESAVVKVKRPNTPSGTFNLLDSCVHVSTCRRQTGEYHLSTPTIPLINPAALKKT